MEEIKHRYPPIRFGVFEVDLQAGELRKQGFKVKLQDQPFQVLAMLLERPGEMVTREELQKKLWPADTFVDFEPGLNRAINKLREALADDAESPRFIETLPRRGYRFVAPVDAAGTREAEASGRKGLALVPADLPPEEEIVGLTGSTISERKHAVPPWVAIGVAAGILAVAAVYWSPWRAPQLAADRPLLQFDLDVGPDEFSQPAISRDGMRIVFVSKSGLATRRLDQAKAVPLQGTEGAQLPFFSPNGQWIGFFANRKLQKIAVGGGPAVTLCDAPREGGGTWGDDDTIVATLNASEEGLFRIPATGGVPQVLTHSKSDPSGVTHHLWPQALPGGKGILFASIDGSVQGSLWIFTPKNGTFKTLVANASDGRYLASGYLIYFQQETLFAAPMDLGRLEWTGPAVRLVDGVSKVGFGRGDFDLSASGTLVYRSKTAGSNFVATWLYPSGKTEPVIAKPGAYFTPRVSPDGTRLALAVTQDSKQNLWIYDLNRQTFHRLTFGPGPDFGPAWTPDSQFIAFRSGNSLAWIRSDGSGKVEQLKGVGPNASPSSFSPDGEWLAFFDLQPGSDIFTVPVERTPDEMRMGQPHRLVQGTGSKGAPAISPDSRWVAYTSDESGNFEVYVVPFSPQTNTVTGKWRVSNGGGINPVWSRSRPELFYNDHDHRVLVAAYAASNGSFLTEKSRVWSEIRLGDTTLFSPFDLALDGKRVLALMGIEDSRAATHIRVLLHVDSELRLRAAVR